jgi:MinD superfamily P-loop ATPase
MKQLLILSGKGGTGKTTVAGALIQLSNCKSYADCDVDAPNLHLIMRQDVMPESNDFYGMEKYEIDPEKCIGCGLCQDHCRFDAVFKSNDIYKIDAFACEGCATCEFVCPNHAISAKPNISGELLFYRSKAAFSTAKLHPGGGNSGLLVTEVKKQLSKVESSFKIIDGSPGIGCPVIASISGADLILLVVEPTLSGLSDMKRIVRTANKFHTPMVCVINKVTDYASGNVAEIRIFCEKNNISFLGTIPYDGSVSSIINEGKSVIESDCLAGNAIRALYGKIYERIFE